MAPLRGAIALQVSALAPLSLFLSSIVLAENDTFQISEAHSYFLLPDYKILNKMRSGSSPIDSCTPSAMCAEDYNDSIASVGAIYVSEPPQEYCTGTMINGPDGQPYLLVAYHCWLSPGADQSQISSQRRLRHFNFVLDYQLPCDDDSASPPLITHAVSPFKLVAYEEVTDMVLLKPYNPMPTNWGLHLAGIDARWNAVGDAPGITLFHHPSGSPKKVSYAEPDGVYNLTKCLNVNNGGQESQYCPETHFMVNWNQGYTYPGSSGSAAIDSDSKRVLGTLTGDTGKNLVERGLDPCKGQPLTKKKETVFARLAQAWSFFYRAFKNGTAETVTDGKPYTLDGPGVAIEPPVFVLDAQPGASFDVEISLANHTAKDVVVELYIMPYDDIFDFLNDDDANTGRITVTPDRLQLSTDEPQNVTLTIDGGEVPAMPQAGFLRFALAANVVPSSDDGGVGELHMAKGFINPNADPQALYKFDTPFGLAETNGDAADLGIVLQAGGNESYVADESSYSDPDGLAIFTITANDDGADNVTVCLRPGLVEASVAAIYKDNVLSSALSVDTQGDPDCLYLHNGHVSDGSQYQLVISDDDLLQAVLPLAAVTSVTITPISKSDIAVEVPNFVQTASSAEDQIASQPGKSNSSEALEASG